MRWDSDRTGLQRQLQSWQAQAMNIGFVPTMGCLHSGHLSLVEASASQCDKTVVSIFVNPTQFGPNEDYESYPRNEDRDVAMAVQAGADLIWVPHVDDIYGDIDQTRVTPGPLASRLCGVSRPQFFGGICSVVLKLFQIVRPDMAYFGEKDYQQLRIITQMVDDFFMPVRVVGCPIIREPDGLAMSSRNIRIPNASRQLACHLYQTIQKARKRFAAGFTDPGPLTDELIRKWPEGLDLDYLEFRDPHRLELVTELEATTRLFLGAWLRTDERSKGIRLIDNAALVP